MDHGQTAREVIFTIKETYFAEDTYTEQTNFDLTLQRTASVLALETRVSGSYQSPLNYPYLYTACLQINHLVVSNIFNVHFLYFACVHHNKHCFAMNLRFVINAR